MAGMSERSERLVGGQVHPFFDYNPANGGSPPLVYYISWTRRGELPFLDRNSADVTGVGQRLNFLSEVRSSAHPSLVWLSCATGPRRERTLPRRT